MPRALSPSYEAQQAELQRMEQGEELQIEVPKEPEVNPEVYKDVEQLLFRGFIMQAADINDVHFVFKTLNHHEYELIRLCGSTEKEGVVTQRFWNMFLAYSVLMIDGINILPDRENHIPKIVKMFEGFHQAVKARLVRYLSEINRRATNAVTLTECYATERYSRYRWNQVQGLDLTSTALTGIAGTERLGLNWAQLIWRAINRLEDAHETMEREWDNAKFIGSCSAGKGVAKIYHQDNERRKREREERVARKDRLLRHVLLGEPLEDGSALKKGNAIWVTANSVEDLTKQLQSDLRGEKDWHDVVVDAYESRIRDTYTTRMGQLQEMAQNREKEFGGKALVGSTDLTGLSSVQVHERMLRQRQIEAQNAASRMTWPELEEGSNVQKTLMRLGVPTTPQSEVQTSIGQTDQDTTEARPLPVTQRPVGKPFALNPKK